MATTNSGPCRMTNGEVEALAERAAKIAVRETFAILGVDVEEPKDVESFRRDLRFAGDMRKYTSHAVLAGIGAVGVAVFVALKNGIAIAGGN